MCGYSSVIHKETLMRNWITAGALSLALMPAILLGATSDEAVKPKPVVKANANARAQHPQTDIAQAKA